MIQGSLNRAPSCILLLSGGIDSMTLLHKLVSEGNQVATVTFDYGQSLLEELDFVRRAVDSYSGSVEGLMVRMTLPSVQNLCVGGELPRGRTAGEIEMDQDVPLSYVPFRNGIFLSWCVALAETCFIRWGGACASMRIFAGCNGLHSGYYPDDTAEFGAAMTVAGKQGTGPQFNPRIVLPWANRPKRQIVAEGLDLGMHYSTTLSCYKPKLGSSPHCGKCDSCAQRADALAFHGLDLEGRPLSRLEPKGEA